MASGRGTESGPLRAGSPVRVGRDEREACVDALQDHYAAGRLGEQELDDRVQAALTATTRADLATVLDDLPASRSAGRVRPERRPSWAVLAGTVAVGAAVVAAGVFGGASPSAPAEAQPYCVSTGDVADPGAACPELSALQQQIISDADRADRAAQQLQELADQNPAQHLGGLRERAEVSARRASDATSTAQELVRAADGKPSAKLLADLAETSRQAADDTQKAVDRAVDKIDG